VTFELYYRGPGEALVESADTFYHDDNVDDDRRLLVEVPDTMTDSNRSTVRRDDVKRYDGVTAPSSTSPAGP